MDGERMLIRDMHGMFHLGIEELKHTHLNMHSDISTCNFRASGVAGAMVVVMLARLKEDVCGLFVNAFANISFTSHSLK